MSADKHQSPSKAEVFAGWLDGRVHLHQHDRDEIAVELRRLSDSEAALIEALESCVSLLECHEGASHRAPLSDEPQPIIDARAAIARAKDARNG